MTPPSNDATPSHTSNSPSAGTLTGRVIKYHSNYYYVDTAGKGWTPDSTHPTDSSPLLECFVRGVLKKSGVDIRVGDKVTVETVDCDPGTGWITHVFPRENELERPKIANVDQVFIMTALNEPEFNPRQLDRYLTHIHLAELKPVILLSKSDLPPVTDGDGTVWDVEHITRIYNHTLQYPLHCTSIHQPGTINEVKDAFAGTVSVLAGQSGVGKSSFLNKLKPDLNLRVGEVSEKIARGQHTTRHVELICLDTTSKDASTWVADTPGFSQLRLEAVTPKEVELTFADFANLRQGCRFSDCLHRDEEGCAVLENLDQIVPSRWASYEEIVQEALELQEVLEKTSQKDEEGYKIKHSGKGKKNTRIARLKGRDRESSRRTQRQEVMNIWDTESLDDEELS